MLRAAVEEKGCTSRESEVFLGELLCERMRVRRTLYRTFQERGEIRFQARGCWGGGC